MDGAGEGAGDWSPRPAANSDLEAFDLVPQRAVLALVGRPYLLLRNFPEFVDLGFHHDHAERLQLRFGLREIVDRLGHITDLLLRGPRKIHHQLLLLRPQTVPDVEIHTHSGRS